MAKYQIVIELDLDDDSPELQALKHHSFRYLLNDAFAEFFSRRTGTVTLHSAECYVRNRYATLYPEGGEAFKDKVAEVYRRCKLSEALWRASKDVKVSKVE